MQAGFQRYSYVGELTQTVHLYTAWSLTFLRYKIMKYIIIYIYSH